MPDGTFRPAFALALIALLPPACHRRAPTPQTQSTPAPNAAAVDAKLDPSLRALAAAAAQGDAKAAEAAQQGSVPMKNGLVRVQITAADAGKAPAVVDRVKASGGVVAAQLSNVIFADIPPGKIRELAAGEDVWSISVPGQAAMAPR
jgi:hypothetical protein